MSLRITAVALAMGSILGGCSSSSERAPAAPEPVYRVAEQRYAAEPEYNRQGWVLKPYPIPGEEVARGNRFSQEHTISLSNVRVEEASRQIGKLFGYRTFVASAVADDRVSLSKERGDIERLAEALAREAQIRVVIDHETREMRVFALKLGE